MPYFFSVFSFLNKRIYSKSSFASSSPILMFFFFFVFYLLHYIFLSFIFHALFIQFLYVSFVLHIANEISNLKYFCIFCCSLASRSIIQYNRMISRLCAVVFLVLFLLFKGRSTTFLPCFSLIYSLFFHSSFDVFLLNFLSLKLKKKVFASLFCCLLVYSIFFFFFVIFFC